VIYLTTLNHANAPLQVGIVAKLVNFLFCCLWGGEGRGGGGKEYNQKKKRAQKKRKKKKEEMENERTSTLAELQNYM